MLITWITNQRHTCANYKNAIKYSLSIEWVCNLKPNIYTNLTCIMQIVINIQIKHNVQRLVNHIIITSCIDCCTTKEQLINSAHQINTSTQSKTRRARGKGPSRGQCVSHPKHLRFSWKCGLCVYVLILCGGKVRRQNGKKRFSHRKTSVCAMGIIESTHEPAVWANAG